MRGCWFIDEIKRSSEHKYLQASDLILEDNVTKRGGLLGVLGQIYICVAVFLNLGHLLSQDVQIRKK